MTAPTRFAICGTHNTGKTTLCHGVVSTLMRMGVSVGLATEPARSSRFLAEGERSMTTQLDLFAQSLANESEAGRKNRIVICDRSLVDVLAYTDELDTPRGAFEISLDAGMKAMSEHYVPTYAGMFMTGWRFEMSTSSDPLRIGDEEFQARIASNIERWLQQLYPTYERLEDPATALDVIVARVLERA